MDKNLQPVAKVPFLGQMYQVFVNQRQWQEIRFDGKRFWANSKIAKDFDRLVESYEKFCKKQLASIIQNQIARLKTKKIPVELMYTDGVKTFVQRENLSVRDYLKKIGYKEKLEYKIGHYEKEWGINEINPKQKKFVLYFNQSLIKYDNGPHIEYVVAHELTHVFHRDHGDQFQATLARIFPKKRTSEQFFNRGIGRLFQPTEIISGKVWLWVFGLIILLIAGYWVFGLVMDFWQSSFGGGLESAGF